MPVVNVLALVQCQAFFLIAPPPLHVGTGTGREGRLTVFTGALLSQSQVSPNLQPACNQLQPCHQVNWNVRLQTRALLRTELALTGGD